MLNSALLGLIPWSSLGIAPRAALLYAQGGLNPLAAGCNRGAIAARHGRSRPEW